MTGVGGIVLAGGQSRRMGTPKAWLRHGGVTLLERAVATLGEVASPVVIAAAAGQALPVTANVVRDAVPDAGPLAGLHAGLLALADSDAVLVLAVDLPLMTAEVLQQLVETMVNEPTADAVVPSVDGAWQPLAAVYRRAILPRVEEHLRRGRRSMHALLGTLKVATAEGLPAAAFANWNTPADVA